MRYFNCYWSPTGGTRLVANTVAQGWGEDFTPVDLMKPLEQKHFRAGDLCLVAVPSYGGRVPEPAVKQLGSLCGNGAMAVLIAVFGNRAIDDTLAELSDVLHRSGFRCIAAMEAVAQHSLMPQFGAGRPDEQDQQELQNFAQKIRQAVESDEPLQEPELPGNRPYKKYSGVPLKPSVSGGCIGCGLCAAQCPAGAIPMNNFRMTDTSKCISCMRCVEVCPAHVRKLSRFMSLVAGQAMKKSCTDRKPNQLYL